MADNQDSLDGDTREEVKEDVSNDEADTSLDSLKVPGVDELDSRSNEQIAQKGGLDLSELQKLEAEAKDNYDKYLYAMAEIDNMKKRHIKERSELIKYNGENIARDMLEVLDDLERTCEQGRDISTEVLFEGIQLISSRMKSIFERHQVKVSDDAGKPFDPSKHEALTMTPSADVSPGTILHQLKKAYYFKDKLLRPAQVVVACEVDSKTDQ